MSAFGWITTGHRVLVASFLRRRTPRKFKAKASVPVFESLETMSLMSTLTPHAAMAVHTAAQMAKPAAVVAKHVAAVAKPAAVVVNHVAAVAKPTPVVARPVAPVASTAQVQSFASKTVKMNAALAATSQTTKLQTVTVPDTLTNFSQPFAPPITLFNPSLGTLVAVHVTAQATLTSQITSENTSTTSEATITGFTAGTYSITGINRTISGSLNKQTDPITVPAFGGGVPDFTGPSTAVFPTLTTTSSEPPITFTAPSDLAFFTASAGRTTISPVLTENARSGANAPNGNLLTLVRTSGSGVITVTYEYSPECPAVTKLVRFGIHMQPTQLQLTFAGPLDPAQASNPAYYHVIAPNAAGSFTGQGTTIIPVTSAVYDAVNHTVTLTTAKRLNVHHLYQLVVNLPCANGNPTVIEFGSKMSLGGFTNPHTGSFIPVVGGVPQYPHGPGAFPA